MKIFDCFMYFDEDLILDLRLNYLNEYVDHFVVVESKYAHNGEKRKPKFDIKRFEKSNGEIAPPENDGFGDYPLNPPDGSLPN